MCQIDAISCSTVIFESLNYETSWIWFNSELSSLQLAKQLLVGVVKDIILLLIATLQFAHGAGKLLLLIQRCKFELRNIDLLTIQSKQTVNTVVVFRL